jgi:KipI family sensor histidine kinase inhibitor
VIETLRGRESGPGYALPAAIAPLGESAALLWYKGVAPGTAPAFLPKLAAYCRGNFDEVLEAVPAATSLLLIFSPDVTDVASTAREMVEGYAGAGDVATLGNHHDIPVNYGIQNAPDLEDVARSHRTSTEQIVTWHSRPTYRVGFLGFLPGFAYLGPTPLQVATRRRASPRPRVPGGSVAVAGRYTGIYPFASPGGWNLIGRTSVRLWDPAQEVPALLQAGDTVRFVPTHELPDGAERSEQTPEPGYPLLRVEAGGGPATIQDRGRTGFAHFGLGQGGSSDQLAAGRANALVGNEPGAAVLEMHQKGPSLRVLRGTLIALDGADLGCRVDGLMVPVGVSWFVRAGSLITFQQSAPSQSGANGFLAVPGGLDVPAVLGSRSTSLVAHMGGYAGRTVQTGDVLGVPREPDVEPMQAGKFWMPRPDAPLQRVTTLRVIRYSGTAAAPIRCWRAFCEKQWQVVGDVSRVGLRLTPVDGAPLSAPKQGIPSFGVVRGTVQLPPGGEPLVLGVDGGTTGGYPVLGVIAEVDWPLAAQLLPGRRIRFSEISESDAKVLRNRQAAEHRAGLARLDAK